MGAVCGTVVRVRHRLATSGRHGRFRHALERVAAVHYWACSITPCRITCSGPYKNNVANWSSWFVSTAAIRCGEWCTPLFWLAFLCELLPDFPTFQPSTWSWVWPLEPAPGLSGCLSRPHRLSGFPRTPRPAFSEAAVVPGSCSCERGNCEACSPPAAEHIEIS